MSIIPVECKRGHRNEYFKRKDAVGYKCRGCDRERSQRRYAANVAKGLTVQGNERSEWMTRTVQERFWAKVEPTGFCWEWTAYRQVEGYGMFGLNRSSVLAHRWAYEELVGPIPEGLTLDHLCRNTGCVNPDHLEPITSVENVRRGFSISRRNGEKTHCAQGHEYSEDNTARDAKGFRRCKTCVKAWAA